MGEVLRSLALVGVVWLTPASGAEVQASGAPSMLDETRAAEDEFRALQGRLDSLADAIRSRLEQPAAERLRRLQVQWTAFAKADCTWERGLSGGSIAALVYTTCMRQRLIERIERLKPLLCEGAGATGPCEDMQKF